MILIISYLFSSIKLHFSFLYKQRFYRTLIFRGLQHFKICKYRKKYCDKKSVTFISLFWLTSPPFCFQVKHILLPSQFHSVLADTSKKILYFPPFKLQAVQIMHMRVRARAHTHTFLYVTFHLHG